MPVINISDEDYTLLMELSKELQTQENDSQAFPYFWGPRSTKSGIGTEDDDPMVYDNDAAETFTPEEYAEYKEAVFSAYLLDEDLPADTTYEDIDEVEWVVWIGGFPDCSIVYSREEEVSEHNFSLFKDDVKGFIQGNSHHLGANPHTYARTFFRMTKMEKLIKVICRLNTLPKEDINEEARRFVFER